MPRGGDEDGRQRGIAIHRLLELMTGSSAAGDSSLTERVALELGISANDPELRQWSEEARQLLASSALQQVLRPDTGDALNEVPLIYLQQGRTVHGVIDRLLLRDGEIWIVDYKTHRQATHTNLSELAAPYQEQLQYYAEGIARLWPGQRIRTFLLFTHCQELFETTSNTPP
jgi:ATP-dependent helicase/nuclease subunit A